MLSHEAGFPGFCEHDSKHHQRPERQPALEAPGQDQRELTAVLTQKTAPSSSDLVLSRCQRHLPCQKDY
jgi:hypothetical protein